MDQPSTNGIILELPSTNSDTINGDFLGQPSTNGIISEHPLALLDVGSRQQTELEELNGQLENLQQEYKKELASMGDRISTALIEKFFFYDAQGNEKDCKPPLDPHQLTFAERRQMFSSLVGEKQHSNVGEGVVAASVHYREENGNELKVTKQVACPSFVGVLSQSGNSNIGKGFNWNPEAVVFSPISEECKETGPLSVDALHEGIAHRESASDSEYFEVV